MWDILLDYQTMYKLNLKTYWLDFCVSTLIFILCLFNLNIFTFIVGAIFLYRAGAFTHEIAHQSKNPEITLFKTVWDYTLGFLILQPSLRFTKPHLAHHTTGIFGTVNDPQYPLIRSNTKLAINIRDEGLRILNLTSGTGDKAYRQTVRRGNRGRKKSTTMQVLG